MTKLSPVIKQAQEFAETLIRNANEQSPPLYEIPGVSFSHAPFGTLMLSEHESSTYRKLLADLHWSIKSETSERKVADAFETALLKSFVAAQTEHPDEGIKDAFKELERELSQPPKLYSTWIPIAGAKLPATPWTIGNVIILDPNGAEGAGLREDHETVIASSPSASANEHFRERISNEVFQENHGRPFAVVSLIASDTGGAWRAAQRRLREVLDCLNAVIEIIYGESSRRGLTDLPISRVRSGLISRAANELRLQSELAGFIDLDLGEFLGYIGDEPKLVALLEYIGDPSPNRHRRRILSAVQWAGRSAVEARREEAFMKLSIAWESLLLGKEYEKPHKKMVEWTITLLGDWLRDPSKSRKELRDLYDKRSQIVHSGTFQVLPSELSNLWGYFSRCLARTLGESFVGMSEKLDIDKWIQARLSSEADSDSGPAAQGSPQS